MENKRGFSSRLGFIFSMAAFSIGIGNLWKFPYVVGNNGGGAFLLVYLLMVLLVGIPAFIIEVALGRSAGLSGISGMRKLEGKKTPWSSIGWLGTIAIFIICSYATTIVGGWTLGYTWKIAAGQMMGLTSEAIGGVFGAYCGSWISLIPSLICAALLLLCVTAGIKKGVEKVCSIMLPTLFVIMIILAIYALTLDGAGRGLLWYITPDFSKINYSVISAAGIQVCFSIGIGMCCAFVYGSYLQKDSNMVGSLVTTAILDTCVAVLAGLICTPALFAFNIEPTAGPSLIFITLPELFNAMGSFGRIFGLLFMLCVFCAGFTSILGGTESLIATVTDGSKLSRKHAAYIIVAAEFLVSILFTRSFAADSLIAKFKLLGMGFFDFGDFIASGVCLTVGAVLMLAYVIFRWGFKKFKDEANSGAAGKVRIYDWMKPYLYYIYPIILIVLCYSIVRIYI